MIPPGDPQDATRQAQIERIEAIGRLAGGMAHDFNNLLSVMLGHAERVLHTLGPDHPERASVAQIIWSGRKAGELTRQLLAFSRRQVLEPRVIRLDEVAKDARGMLERLVGEDVTLVIAAPSELASVRADPGQIVSVLVHLAMNARDAMPRGGRLTIEFSEVTLDARYAASHLPVRPGQYVLMAVTDTGEGMDTHTKGRVFGPFFTPKPMGVGTGLGLSTVYGIVKQSEGFIWVYSEPGVGTTFKVYLPRLDQPAGSTRAPEPAPAGGRPQAAGSRVLLVEDDDDVRALMADILETEGYQVSPANQPSVALDLAERSEPFDLVVTDVIMPGMGGRELARRLSERQPGLRTLYVSGYAGEALALAGGIERQEFFLQKPFSERALLDTVADALG
jgi:nitrogen-specific signal transduction histidine kinase